MRPTVIAALSVLLSGCTRILPGVGAHDVRFDATALARDNCDPAPVDPKLYGPEAIWKVEPYYRYVLGGPNGRDAHFSGARLSLRPSVGVTAELLERGLLCHSAHVMLGDVAAANDPYALPDTWVKLDVSSGRGTFIVTVAPDDATRAREIYERAVAYAPHAP